MENPEYKLLFLKAIKLGIMYGESKKSNFYKDKINEEINSIMLLNVNKKEENITYDKEDNSIDDNSIKENTDFEKKNNYDSIIINLENQKNIILQNIQNLSINYSSNYTKINFLKFNLVNIMKELDKYNNFRKEELKNVNTTIIKKNIVEIKKKDVVHNENLTSELQDTFNKLSNLIIS
jgi:hypothetical protein